jgi:mannose-6-phosphate isomerase-like protein (cupin superfamily)
MVQIVHTDTVVRVPPGSVPPYDQGNPLLRLLGLVEETRLAAAREAYDTTSLQYLFPISHLELWGPAGQTDQLDPALQDDKTDFQKQNLRGFRVTDTRAVRGWVTVGGQRVPFLHLSYRAGPDTALQQAAGRLGDAIGCTFSLRGGPPVAVRAPYDAESGRYVVEIWGRSPQGLRELVDARGAAAIDSGRLQGRDDLGFGGGGDFSRAATDAKDVRTISPGHLMHPVLPLHVDVRWTSGTDGSGVSEPVQGAARLGFEMQVRGWDSYLSVGTSANPHGGVGFLEYRNLLSNYGAFAGSRGLARPLEPWNFDAAGTKDHPPGAVEQFMAVDYMDLHVMEAACGIGLHRHRDNQEVFLMLDGSGLMVVGDWADSGSRHRCLEVRTLPAGSLAMLRGGNLHGLLNPADRRALLFMFGGYD